MDIENKEDIAEFVKLLRFQPRNYESAAADVIENLMAYKEAAEKQEPVQWVCELASNPWPYGGGTRRDTKEDALSYIHSDRNYSGYDTVSPIYRLPVPADKPAVAVPDNELLSAKKEVEDLCGKAPFYPVDAEKLRNLCVRLIDENMLLRSAAPSHSQQSAADDRLREFADEVKQLCSDFSDRQNRPYMGDVTAAIDGLYTQFCKETKGA